MNNKVGDKGEIPMINVKTRSIKYNEVTPETYLKLSIEQRRKYMKYKERKQRDIEIIKLIENVLRYHNLIK